MTQPDSRHTAPAAARQWGAMLASLLVAALGAGLWQLIHFPLPWLVGSLYAVALMRTFGLPLLPPPGARQCGQWVIGTSMGLYFTPVLTRELVAHAGLIAGMAVFSLAMGMAGAYGLVRLRLADPATAFFSAMPGGASEMANLSDMWSAAVDRVAAAHAMRVMLVVLVVPLAISVAGSHGDILSGMAARPVVWSKLPWMAVASLGGAAAFLLLRLPNAWVLGPMSVIATLGILEMPLSGLPTGVSASGQLLIGVALGCRFGPGFLRKAPAFLGAIALISLLFLAVTASVGWLLQGPTGLSVADLVLSFSPGGIAEMSITASHLHLGVPLVVASHVTRLVVLTVSASTAYRGFSRLLAR